MKAGWRDIHTEAAGLRLTIAAQVENRSRERWTAETVFLAWQFFDPDTNRFIQEGEWTPVPADAAPGETVASALQIDFPPEPGGYRIYLSTVTQDGRWGYCAGSPFLLVDAVVEPGGVHVLRQEVSTLGKLRREAFRKALPKLFSLPIAALVRNRTLLRSMVRRDILARYRGSIGDVLWTVLNPLLLMLTYFFVFGIVLHQRFGTDASGAGYVLYFLAGMLPWLAFSEAAGRAPYIVIEHRNWVKKVVFPLEILPVVPVISGIVTEVFAIGIFAIVLLALRGHVPLTVFWLPALIVPQILFTIGLAWFLAALGVYMRDLGQINGYVLTLWFFMTPICYPASAIPQWAARPLAANPMFLLVNGYRAALLDGHAPALRPVLALFALGLIAFFGGHAWFYKLRKSFADVL